MHYFIQCKHYQVHKTKVTMLYLSFNVSMQNFTIVDVFHSNTHLNKPVNNLQTIYSYDNCKTIAILTLKLWLHNTSVPPGFMPHITLDPIILFPV